MGLPLAFVALPLYVLLPNHYAREFGVPLASLGAVLLAVRLLDTVVDPLLGRWADQLRAPQTTLNWAAAVGLLMCLGFCLLFFPPLALQARASTLLPWLAGTLALTTLAFSALTIVHQAWGARLGGNALYRSRVVAWREGLGLVGVLIASIAPVAMGLPATAAFFIVAVGAGWLAWCGAPRPLQLDAGPQPGFALRPVTLLHPWRHAAFRHLLAVFMVNGIASALPATLLLFYVQDRLRAPASMEPVFLGSYFACAALSIPLWLRCVPRWGLARTWAAGMLLAVAVFAFAAALDEGDAAWFVAVCALSGVALSTDLALPAALLAGVIQRSGDQQHAEGAYFGWWAFVSKLNLALAAGVALPALGWLGYQPGATDAQALQTLTLAYCVVPCLLKTCAALLLYTLIIRKTP
ncbi:MAG: MFS transporter [Comamonadaceae bacterium CG1_02_60_18]|nr:MAG: MFS transporter [Comamonadaceae bacterium CG1_02_60_18]